MSSLNPRVFNPRVIPRGFCVVSFIAKYDVNLFLLPLICDEIICLFLFNLGLFLSYFDLIMEEFVFNLSLINIILMEMCNWMAVAVYETQSVVIAGTSCQSKVSGTINCLKEDSIRESKNSIN